MSSAAGHLTMRRQVFLLLGAILGLAGCGPDTPAPDTETLVFADPTQPMVALLYVAEAEGYFAARNLKIEHLPVTSGRDSLEQLLAGKADIGAATEFPFANNILAGRDLRILTTLYRSNAYSGVVARTDRGIAATRDLREKTVGIAPNTNTDYMLSLMLKEAGLGDADVRRIPLKPEEMADALAQGRVDAVATWSPHLGDAQARFAPQDVVVLRTPIYLEMSILGTRGDVANHKAEALGRLVEALVEAEDFVARNSDRALAIVIERIGLSGKAAEALHEAWPEYHHQARLDNFMLSSLRLEAAWISQRQPTRAPLPDFADRIVTQPLKAARPRSVTIAE
jgi:ABC-type nitrate/sulfonate/bicarbonate transport system substrate-binding protein